MRKLLSCIVVFLMVLFFPVSTVIGMGNENEDIYKENEEEDFDFKAEFDANQKYPLTYNTEEPEETIEEIAERMAIERAEQERIEAEIEAENARIKAEEEAQMEAARIEVVSNTGLTDQQYEILLAVVQQEGGTAYDSARAVMSTIYNRAFMTNTPTDIWTIVTAPNQFEAYGAGHYTRRLGQITPEVRQAVEDVLTSGPSHNYYSFCSIDSGCQGEFIGGNAYR